MNRHNQSIIHTFGGFAEQSEKPEDIKGFLSILPKLPNGILIRQYIIFHKLDINEVIEKRIRELSPVRKVFTSSFFYGFEFKDKTKGTQEKGYFGILPGSTPHISRIVSVSYSDFWSLVVRRLVKKFYPDAMPIFFRQTEIEQSLFNLEKGLGHRYQIRIADVTAKEERELKVDSRIRKYDTQRWWTNLPIAEVFNQAKERGQWFTGLRFLIQQRIGNSDKFVSQATGRLYKFGEVNYNLFDTEISSFLLNVLECHAYKRLSTLDGRSARERDYRPVLPIEITFDYDVFSDIAEIRRFGKVVSDYPNSTKVVYHANPYYHASVADFLDGSSFDVWVLSFKKVVLIPQAKSSALAFERFINHISANFNEGVVDEYQE